MNENWNIPDLNYFDELFRISKNQIIWGVNYFDYKFIGGRIIWIKGEQGSPFSMADIAYQSFYNRIDVFKHLWTGFWKEKQSKNEKRIHPTQKPVALYKWLLKNYAKSKDKIFDSHGGSMSIAIACYDMKHDLVCCEKDKDYYNEAVKRFKNHKAQLTLF